MIKPVMKQINGEDKGLVAKEKYGNAAGKNEFIDSEFEADRIGNLIPSARRTRIFDLLNLVDDLHTNSLDDVLEKAIAEGEKFKEWKNSDRGLDNIRLFHKVGGKFEQIKPEQNFFSGLFGDIFEVETVENSQFEIWKCNKDERDFPLYRIPLSKVIAEGKLVVNEKLKENCFLKIQAEKKKDLVCFAYSMCHLAEEFSLLKNINSFTENYKEMMRKGFQLLQPQIPMLLIILLILLPMISFLPNNSSAKHTGDQYKNSSAEQMEELSGLALLSKLGRGSDRFSNNLEKQKEKKKEKSKKRLTVATQRNLQWKKIGQRDSELRDDETNENNSTTSELNKFKEREFTTNKNNIAPISPAKFQPNNQSNFEQLKMTNNFDLLKLEKNAPPNEEKSEKPRGKGQNS